MVIKYTDRRDIDIFFARKQYHLAIDSLERLCAQYPEEFWPVLKLVDAYHLSGRSREATELLRRLAKEYAQRGWLTKATTVQKRLQKIDPREVDDIYHHFPVLQAGDLQDHKRTEDLAFRAVDGLFSGLSREEFFDVFTVLSEHNCSRGHIVISQGVEDGNSLFIIVTGSVLVTVQHKGKNLQLAVLKEGEFFGEVSLLTGKRRTASVIAIESTNLLELGRADFLALSSKYTIIRKKLERALEQRTRATILSKLEADRSDRYPSGTNSRR